MSINVPETTEFTGLSPEALLERVLGACLGMMDVAAIYIGDRLGFYQALARNDSLTPSELADRTNTNERYTREWLEQQAVSGLLEVENPGESPEERRFRLPRGHAEVLTDRDSLWYSVGLIRGLIGSSLALPSLLEAFRSGGGIPYFDYGADIREGIADGNRPMFLNLLGAEWFPAITDVHERLSADPPARIADVACGSGWSSVALARAYPRVHIDAFDLDQASVAAAIRNVAAEGLADRITIHREDAADPSLAGVYDLVTIFEALHDMPRPVEALRAMRRLLAAGGSVIVADEHVSETFTAPAGDVERLMYGFSILHCLPVGMADQPSAGTGTVMRPETLDRYARDAGFTDVRVLPIEHDFWRFYRLSG
jgi:2-polyprenyl-3-methyl-5-hydroxy-6-metoxy-1,4-benzoquinol methylase